MRISFIRGADQGYAEYDHSTETYSWSYDGDNSRVISLLSGLEDGKQYMDMVTENLDANADEIRPSVVGEGSEPLPWDDQIKELGRSLERKDFKVGYFPDDG